MVKRKAHRPISTSGSHRTNNMGDTLGERIKARRDAKAPATRPAAESAEDLRAYIDGHIAAIHARIDKLEKK